MYNTQLEEAGSYRRGIRWTAASKFLQEIFGTLVLDPRNLGFSSEPNEENSLFDTDDGTAFVGMNRNLENKDPRVGLRVGDSVLWVDKNGIYATKPITVVGVDGLP